MTSEFSDIFARFYMAVESYGIANLDKDVVDALLGGYVRGVLSDPKLRRLFSSVEVDEDVGEVNYTLRESWDEDADAAFVEEAVARGMVCKWLAPKYHSEKNTSQIFGNKEQTFFSQSNHMSSLKNMLQAATVDYDKFIRDRGYGLLLVNSG